MDDVPPDWLVKDASHNKNLKAMRPRVHGRKRDETSG
jgi:hypothetical protein